jgi:hypothetical protein
MATSGIGATGQSPQVNPGTTYGPEIPQSQSAQVSRTFPLSSETNYTQPKTKLPKDEPSTDATSGGFFGKLLSALSGILASGGAGSFGLGLNGIIMAFLKPKDKKDDSTSNAA